MSSECFSMPAGTGCIQMSFCDEPGRQLHKTSITEIDTHVLDVLLNSMTIG